MDLIYMNQSREDVGVLLDYELDLAFGTDENTFECTVSNKSHCCDAGFYLCAEGTEYGGIIDSVESKNSTQEVIYRGRTWHGILNSKILQPDSGADYLVCSGEANTVIGTLLTRMGLESVFVADEADSGLSISSYKMNRYIGGYDGIVKMLKAEGGKLLFQVQSDGKVKLSAVPIVDYTKDEEFDSDLVAFDAKKATNTVNHLICLGQGELSARTVVHLYADENGNISTTQTQFGLDEYVAVYDNSNAETEDELIEGGKDCLKELMQQDDLSVDFDETDDTFDVGDIVGASDNVTGIAISVPITKKIVTIKNGKVTIDIKTDTGSSTQSTGGGSYSGGDSGGGGTSDHAQLINRDAEDQHPITAITNLGTELSKRVTTSSALTNLEIESLLGE